MNEYEIIWRIELDAESPRQAAIKAYTSFFRGGSFGDATQIEVIDPKTGEKDLFDMYEEWIEQKDD